MAKFDKEPKFSKKTTPEESLGSNKTAAKSKKQLDDDDLDINEIEPSPKKTLKGSAKNQVEDNDEEDIDAEEEVDSRIKVEDEDSWDPDFEEFDLPKSKSSKKVSGGKKGGKEEEEDDFKLDDEFKDMFGKPSSKSEDDEDDF